jgi:sigma-B regulation protein RsbQ
LINSTLDSTADRIIKRNNVTVSGEGDLTLMFAHGFGCDQNTWRFVIPAFKDKYKIVVFDYVGAGGSDLSAYEDERYSDLSGYAQDVLDICSALALENVVFVGHSVSSMIGLIAVVKKPSYFRKIVFIGPSPRYTHDTDYVGAMERGDLEELLEVMDSNYLGWSASVAPVIVGNANSPELSEGLAESFCSTNPEIARKFARVTFLSDNRSDLARLNIPSLTIQCKDDFLASFTTAEYVFERTKGNEMVFLESTGHCPHLSDPENVIRAIENFIAD